jgi:[ribosomal protein S5]-alanine N-acetyltransferase
MQPSDAMFELHSPRLVLRDFVEADWAAMYALSLEPEVTRYQTWLRLPDQARAREWVRDAIDNNKIRPRTTYNLAIALASSGRVVGWIGWGRPSDPAKGDYNFGYALHPDVWEQGYMTEALAAMVDFIFETLGAQMVTGDCASSNRGSARVMEKAGLVLTGRWYEPDDETGSSQEMLRYTITFADWANSR